DGRGRLADAALAARDGDDVLDARDQLHATLHRVRRDLLRHLDPDPPRAGNCRNRVGNQLFQDLVLRLGGIAELDIDRDVAAVDPDFPDRLAGPQIPYRIWIAPHT